MGRFETLHRLLIQEKCTGNKLGDLIGPPALASSSMEQGRRAVCHAYGIDPGHPFNIVPIGIYAIPYRVAALSLLNQARRR